MRRVVFIGLLAGVTMLIMSLAWSAVANFIWPQLQKLLSHSPFFMIQNEAKIFSMDDMRQP